MQIKKLDIYGYGKWVDQRFDLNEGLQVFLGRNEAGKSTLMSFIHSILFGFPTRNSIFLRYEPQKSSKYGGRIIVQDNIFGECIIERVHGKVTGDVRVTLEDGTTGSEELLEQLLKGLTRENFQSIFSFSLSDIENVHQLDKNKLSRYLLNIGAHSTDYYLDLVDEFQKNAYDLYRPSGRIPPLNKQLVKVAEQEKKLEELERKNKSYVDLVKKNKEQSESLHKIERAEKKIQDKLNYLTNFKKELHVLREIQSLKKEITKIQLPILKDDGHYLLEEYKKEITETNELLGKVKEKITIEQKTILNPELITKYQKNKKEIGSLEQDLPEIVEKNSDLETVVNQLTERNQKLFELRKLLKIDNTNVEPQVFSTEEKTRLENWQQSYTQLKTEIESITLELKEFEYKLNLKNQKADQYEELMWDNQYLKDVENQIHREKSAEANTGKPPKKNFSLGLGLVGIFILVASSLTSIFNQWLGTGIGFVVLLIAFLLYRREDKISSKDSKEIYSSNGLLMNEYNKQMDVKSDWQMLLGEIDAIQGKYRRKTDEKLQILNKQENIRKKWMALLTAHHIPGTHLFEEAESVIQQTNELNRLEEEVKKLQARENQLSKDLERKMNIMNIITEEQSDLSRSEKITAFRAYLKELNQLLETEQTKIHQLDLLEEERKQIIAREKKLQSKIQLLLEASGVETEEEFLELYRTKEKLEQKKSRMQFLQENTPSFDSQKPLPSKEELLKQEEELARQLNEHKKESKKIINERADTQVNIRNLEKDGSYSEALQKFENQKASTQKLVDEWISDKIAASIIQDTLNQVTKDRFEEIMTEINHYFKLLTDGEYESIIFKDEELFVQNKSGSVVKVKTLSRGTAEPLYVSIRLAYIVKMRDIIRLPIIIDDPFVNFDQKRKRNIYQLLDQLSDKLQIIYFSFDSELKEIYQENQIIEL